jgi:hypothetical protein
MKTYHVSKAGRFRAAILLITLAVLALYSGRKAWGLWRGISAKPSDVFLFNLNLNTTVPALLLTLVTLAALAVIWYLVVELLTVVRLNESGLLITAPGYRLFYRWNEVVTLDVITGPVEDAPVCLRVETAVEEAQPETEATPVADDSADEIAPYLSEADLREDKTARQRARELRRKATARVQARATRPDGRALPGWMRLLYPQVRQPDRLLLYPALEDRVLLLAEIESHLAKV